MNALPPAGWYDDPENPGYLRYWDATEWTDHRSPHGSSTSGKLSDVGTWLNDTFVAVWEARGPVLALGGLLLGAWAIAAGFASWALNDAVYIDGDGWQGFHGDRTAIAALVSLGAAAGSVVMYLALIHQLHTRRVGDAPTLGASLIAATRAAPRAIGWTLAIMLAAVVGLVAVIVLALLIGPLVILVVLALIPLSIWLWIKLSFLLVACVAPVVGTNAVKASAEVSSAGRFWGVLGRLLLLSIIGAVVAFIVGIPFGSVSGGDFDAVLVTDGSDNIESFHLGNFLDEAGLGGGALVLLSAIPQMISSLLTISGSTDLYAQVHGRSRSE